MKLISYTTRTSILTLCLALLTLFAWQQQSGWFKATANPVSAAAAVSGGTQRLVSAEQAPDGLQRDDWNSNYSAYEKQPHAVVAVADEQQARNPGQQWRTRFDGRGFAVTPGPCDLKADYQFQNTLDSSAGSAPTLSNLGNNTFGTATVDGTTRTVLSFPQQSGLVLGPTTGVISNNVYTAVVLFSFNDVSSYRRILDFKNNATDYGLYNRSGSLVFYTDSTGGNSAPIVANSFVQVVLTRDAAKNVTGYVNGVQQFTFVDTSDRALIGGNNRLIFFRDNDTETSAGAVARIRLYDCALTASQVAALDRLPGGPTPTPTPSTMGAIFAPSGINFGGRRNGSQFEVGVAGTSPNDNNWPSNEAPPNAIDRTTAKYLNFAKLNTGIIVKPAFGSVATSLQIWTANDAPRRDPASYELYGTNSTICGPGPFSMALFTLISSGSLSLPAGRNDGSLNDTNSQTVTFSNTTAYQSYLLLFPTVKDQNDNSMQIGEVQLFGNMDTSNPLPTCSTCPTITVIPPVVSNATAGQPFSATFTQTGGSGTTTFSTASALPTGLTLAANGTLSGTPTQTGTFPIVVTATDSNNCMGTVGYTLQVVRLTGSISDPLACTGPGGLATGTIQISNPAAAAQTFTLTTTFTNYAGVPGSCVLTGAAAGATCTVTAGVLTVGGNIPANTTLTVTYQAQVATVPAGTVLTASNVATLGGATLLPNPLVFSTTVNCPALGPGQVLPATAEASDQKAGSVLIYNLLTSGASNSTTQNTRINLTNTHTVLSTAVHLFFIDGATCSVADSYLCLTPNQTTSFLASDIDPGTTGYLVAVAVDLRGCPRNFNYLIGDEYVKLPAGHAANLGAQAFSAIAGGLPACDGNAVTAQLNFDGVSYDRMPAALALSNIGSRADGNDTLLIVNRIGGNLGSGASTLGTLFGILYNDAENALSFQVSGNCQLRNSISNNFPRTAPRFETFIPAGRTGWLKLFSLTGTVGITGAAINFNANAASAAGAFNQGHNLHALTLSSAASFVIPVIPPGC